MQTVTLAEAQKHLQELVRDLPREGDLLITDADKPVARLSPVTSATVRVSLRDIKPASVGAVLRPFPAAEDDTLGEMLDARQ
jgi:antitoxin (DNA-binding transcriptional repressor) of toxin-antitoxin stability system